MSADEEHLGGGDATPLIHLSGVGERGSGIHFNTAGPNLANLSRSQCPAVVSDVIQTARSTLSFSSVT